MNAFQNDYLCHLFALRTAVLKLRFIWIVQKHFLSDLGTFFAPSPHGQWKGKPRPALHTLCLCFGANENAKIVVSIHHYKSLPPLTPVNTLKWKGSIISVDVVYFGLFDPLKEDHEINRCSVGVIVWTKLMWLTESCRTAFLQAHYILKSTWFMKYHLSGRGVFMKHFIFAYVHMYECLTSFL